jgi:hypothetical protein
MGEPRRRYGVVRAVHTQTKKAGYAASSFDLVDRRSESDARKILYIAHDVLRVPKRNRYQIMREHKRSCKSCPPGSSAAAVKGGGYDLTGGAGVSIFG